MHFTYGHPGEFATNELRQGDLLHRSDDVEAILSTIHPHYHQQTDYQFLMVLTQSCDLVRRKSGGCKARYITLAAVRPLRTVLDREVENVRKYKVEAAAGIADASRRQTLVQFVERLLNNNEPGYFYLHPDADIGLGEPFCAFLRLSVAVRSGEHYEKCRAAKFGQLTPEFQAKLGWLIGNLYSRVGTADWLDVESESVFADRVADIVDQTTRWVDRKVHPKLVRSLVQLQRDVISDDDVTAAIDELAPRSRRDIAIERLTELLPTMGVNPEAVEKSVRRLLSDPTFSQALRE